MADVNTVEELNREIRTCTRCRLHESRTQAVPNQGDPDADVMFVGKKVGYKDDKVGLPYQGEAGKTVDYVLENVGREREDVFLTNLTRCYPPESRDPKKEELDRCSDYFEKELEIVDPDWIVALGKTAAERLLGRDVKLEDEHGNLETYNTLTFRCKVLLTYNVGAVQYDRSKRDVILDDVKKLFEEKDG
ncbi:MAG: uracil-DNA glycosylase [Halobacteria archaeon]|nr:uracil-DNA glycosylase [Halobacteria archaeon]